MVEPEASNGEEDPYDRELNIEFMRLCTERLFSTGKVPVSAKKISGSTHIVGAKLTLARRRVISGAAIMGIVSVVGCYEASPWLGVIGVLTAMTAVSIPILLLQEFLTGAGSRTQSEFARGDSYYREFSFKPSLQSFRALLGYLCLTVVCIVVGFAAAYAALYTENAKSFSAPCTGFDAIYFSGVSFATVGYGDISPSLVGSRSLVTAEIFVSWLLLSVTFSTLVTWVLSHVQRIQEKTLSSEEKSMLDFENAMKEAGIGLYGDTNALMAEAKRRLDVKRKQSESTDTDSPPDPMP